MTKCPHHHVFCYGESVCRRAYKQVLPVFALDIATDPKSIEVPIPDVILTHPHMSDPPLPPLNDTDHLILLPEPEAKINTPPLPPVDKPADIVSSPLLLTNDSPPIIVTVPSLLSDDDPDVKLNNSLSPSDDKHTLIKIDPLVLLSPQPTSTITEPPAPDDATHVLIKTIVLSPFAELPLFNLADTVLL